jgi:hypothetical protein
MVKKTPRLFVDDGRSRGTVIPNWRGKREEEFHSDDARTCRAVGGIVIVIAGALGARRGVNTVSNSPAR